MNRIMADMDSKDENCASVDAQAREWLVRLTSGRATAADAQAYRQWCARSPRHAEAMAEVSRVWELSKAAGAALAAETPSPVYRPAPVAPNWGRRAFFGSAVAAGAAAYLVVRPPASLWPTLPALTADYRTSKGEQRDLFLDGAAVRMNTLTSVNLRAATELELVSGETQVVLEQALPRPITVLAGEGRLLLSAAARFNVRATGPQVRVTCLQGEGRVDVAGKERILQAGQQALYGGGRLAVQNGANLAALEGWRANVLVFDDVPLAEAVDEINRYRPGRLIVTNAALGRRRVQARLRMEQLPDVVGIIQSTYGAQATVLPAGIVLLA